MTRTVPTRTGLPDDERLPAAAHLVGHGARELLATALTVGDGRLHDARACHVQYRPGTQAVVRYDTTVSWSGAAPVTETLLVGTHRDGPLPGTVPLVADVRGVELAVGVWRWPFDPLMPELADLVTPARAAEHLAGLIEGPLTLDVVAYRPTERAVVRVGNRSGDVIWVKVLPPARVADLAHRHERLAAAGVPVPDVLAADDEQGWIAMSDLAGPTLRDRVKGAPGNWPAAPAFTDLLRRVRSAELTATEVPTRTGDARGHATMLATVAPEFADRLTTMIDALADELAAVARRRAIVHADLHEAQIVLDETGDIVGLLDLDDAGWGDPLDDFATVLAHLRYRRLLADGAPAARLERFTTALADEFAAECTALGHDPAHLDRVTAAALIGLATGPFRTQQADWRATTSRLLAEAEALLARSGERIATVREVSGSPHTRPTVIDEN